MNIIDQLIKPGYQVTDTARNAHCFQTSGKATTYLATIVRDVIENDIVILEVDFILAYVLIYKVDIETVLAKIMFATVVNNVYKPEL